MNNSDSNSDSHGGIIDTEKKHSGHRPVLTIDVDKGLDFTAEGLGLKGNRSEEQMYKLDTEKFPWITKDLSKIIEERVAFINGLISEQLENPEENCEGPLLFLAAERFLGSQKMHQCYWNDRFVVSIVCRMPEHYIRLAAWCLVSNGLNRYFEWVTHHGYSVEKVFEQIGIDVGDHGSEYESPSLYYPLHESICAQLVELFNLPTIRLGKKTTLSIEEGAEREKFNKTYPYKPVL